jgi:hypothetical protein
VAETSGPHTEKLTDPVAVPTPPVTVAESEVTAPSWIDAWAGVDLVVLSAGVTVKHSPLVLSDEPR